MQDALHIKFEPTNLTGRNLTGRNVLQDAAWIKALGMMYAVQ
jgi:hypothetical protein